MTPERLADLKRWYGSGAPNAVISGPTRHFLEMLDEIDRLTIENQLLVSSWLQSRELVDDVRTRLDRLDAELKATEAVAQRVLLALIPDAVLRPTG